MNNIWIIIAFLVFVLWKIGIVAVLVIVIAAALFYAALISEKNQNK